MAITLTCRCRVAREIRQFAVVVPSGTTQAAPLVTPTTFDPREVRRIEWRFPAGCGGLVGFYVAMAKVQILPLPAGTWVVGDNTSGGWDVTGQPNTGLWQVVAYNTGAHSHTLEIKYHADLVESPQRDLELIPDLALSQYTTQLGGGPF